VPMTSVVSKYYKTATMVKIGLLGVGHLGKIHLKCLHTIEAVQITGFYDSDDQVAVKVMANYPTLKRFTSYEELLVASDVVDIVTPTTTHFALAAKAIKNNKHVFIEKPLTHTLEEARQLVELAKMHRIKAQVGYVERFNPAFLSIQHIPLNPLFIEAHRLATFNPRGTDVSVVLDLMIHDLDLVLKVVKAPLTSVHASGVAVVSKSPDIANVRLEFANGATANLTASRISMKKMRKLRLFQKDAYISLDLLDKRAQVIQLFSEAEKSQITNGNLLSLETEEGKKYINIEQPAAEAINAIERELTTFAQAILTNTEPVVTIEEGYKTLQVAHQIIEKMEERKARVGTLT
ncbi:MAG: Gfo/Idh/MocA family oxidoreductase, partial [Bacteroidota bacterium]